MVVREVELILGDKNEKILPKVLALRVPIHTASSLEILWSSGRKTSSKK